MLVVFQLPITDLRRLSLERPTASLLRVPGSTAETGTVDSLRYFGWAEARPAGADEAFPDETCFYSAHRALRLVGLGKKIFARAGVEVGAKIGSFRRLFVSEQRVASRIEVGLSLAATQKPLEFDALIQLLKTVLQLPTEVPAVESEEVSKVAAFDVIGDRLSLVRQDKTLARHFALATTTWSAADLRLAAKLVRPCQPVLVAELLHGEFVPREIAQHLPYFRRLNREHTRGADVWFGQLMAEKRQVPIWLLAPGTATSEILRSLRLCLLRLHAEYSAFATALQWHDQDPRPAIDAEEWKSYLKYVRKNVFGRDTRIGIDQSAIVEAITAVTAVSPQTLHLEERLAAAEQEAFGTVSGHPPDRKPEAPWKAWLAKLERQPDLTIVIEHRNSSLLWNFWALRYIKPQAPEVQNIGHSPEVFSRTVMNLLGAAAGGTGLYGTLRGIGHFIGDKGVPPKLWELLQEIARAVNRPPTVLILSDESCIPWELARDPRSADSSFLAVQAVVGRWPLSDALPGKRPLPVKIRINSAAFIAGHYTGKNGGYQDLPGAEDEVKFAEASLHLQPTQVKRIEASEKELGEYLRSKPKASLLHFAMHGRFDPAFRENGLITTEAKPVSPFFVMDSVLPAEPFVFLNACQIGQGEQVLGGSVSMPGAFLTAGASAVIAPIWAVKDDIAHKIAVDFYHEALHGSPGEDGGRSPSAAELLRRVRAGFDQQATSPTPLAYQFFGHPELRLELVH